MEYTVIRKEIKTCKIFTTVCTQEQLDNITKYPSSLYQIESVTPATPVTPVTEVTEVEKIKRVNTTKELYYIIRRGKRDIKEDIKSGMDRNLIYHLYELIKKDCKKYSEENKTCKQMYFNFLQWWSKYDKILYPEYY